MAKDDRLLPLPTGVELPVPTHDIPAGYPPGYDEDPFGEKRSLREYFNVVYKRLWLIITLAVVVTSAVAFYMFRLPTEYEASSQIRIEQKKPKQTSKDAININFGFDPNYWNTQVKLIQNPDIMREVVASLGLQRDPAFAESGKGVVVADKTAGDKPDNKPSDSSLPSLSDAPDGTNTSIDSLPPQEKAKAEAIASSLLSGLSVVREENTNLFDIKVRHTNPAIAMKVSEAIAKVYIGSEVKRELQTTQNQYDD